MNYDILFLILPWTAVFYIMWKSITSKSIDLFSDVSKEKLDTK
jgi:hypothetical protein